MNRHTVHLRNGAEVPREVVLAVMVTLRSLLQDKGVLGTLTLFDLHNHCSTGAALTDSSYKLLTELDLLDNGYVRDIVRDIVLSAVMGEGLRLHLENPVDGLSEEE